MNAVVPGGHRLRGTMAGRHTAVVLVGVVAVAVAAIAVAALLDRQRYVLLLPMATWRARAVLVAAAPGLLGLAWWLLARTRRAAMAAAVTTVLAQAVACFGGYWLLAWSALIEEIPSEGPETIAVSPAGDFELVRTVYRGGLGEGSYEVVRVRSRDAVASRESAAAVVRCRTSYYETPDLVTWHVVTARDVAFVDETTVDVSHTDQLVRFDPDTLRVDGAVQLPVCPTERRRPTAGG
ncbi:hypothetical protein [Micromonospora sp. CPCC 206061]|uniref:hypothetical protein n=1 Tax=Micromonospora sp. CPCC 206061 TaxID=3122410 RepID=UPI002FEEA422